MICRKIFCSLYSNVCYTTENLGKMHFSEANLEIVKHLLWYLKTVNYFGKKLQLRLNLTWFWIRICFHIMFWKVPNYSKPKKGCKIQSIKKLHLGLANFTSEKIYVQMVNNGEQCLGMFIKNIVDCHWTFLHFVKAKCTMNKIFPYLSSCDLTTFSY